MLDRARFKSRRILGLEVGRKSPVFLRYKGSNFLFPLHNHAQGYCLDPACRQPSAHLLPQQGAHLVTDESIENAAGLLGAYLILIDGGGVLEGTQNRAFRDFVELNAEDLVVGTAI